MSESMRARIRGLIFDALLSEPPTDVREASKELDARVNAVLDVLAEPSDVVLGEAYAACFGIDVVRARAEWQAMIAAIREGK